MSIAFLILTVLFIIVSAVLVLIVLVQRPQGGGLAGAFGGAGGGSTDTVFGGRVGDALTAMTVVAFLTYVTLAIVLNVMDPTPSQAVAVEPSATTQPAAPIDQTPGPVDSGIPGIDVGDGAVIEPILQPDPLEAAPSTSDNGAPPADAPPAQAPPTTQP